MEARGHLEAKLDLRAHLAGVEGRRRRDVHKAILEFGADGAPRHLGCGSCGVPLAPMLGLARTADTARAVSEAAAASVSHGRDWGGGNAGGGSRGERNGRRWG